MVDFCFPRFPMTVPLVSVLITVYNRERFLAAAVDSVLAQTMQDFEAIIVDDGSTDGSVEIARNYAARDNRIRFFRNEKNLGDYPNRNRAASLATGKFLKYLDSDDILYPHSLTIMIEAMRAHPDCRAGFVTLPTRGRPALSLEADSRRGLPQTIPGPGLHVRRTVGSHFFARGF